MEPEPTSESGEYWKEHVLSWEAGAYYKDRRTRPAFWDRVSAIFRGRAMYVRMDAALQLVSPHVAGLNVLDIGCGSGRFAFELLAAGAERVVGIDVSPAAIEAADAQRRQSPSADRLEFRVMDVTLPGAELPQVDLITALGVIEYFDARDAFGAARELQLEVFPDRLSRFRGPKAEPADVVPPPGVPEAQPMPRRLPLLAGRVSPHGRQSTGYEAVRFARRSTFDFATNLPPS